MSNTETTKPASPSSNARKRRSRFTQINRVPWVPERLLEQYGGMCEFDSRFRRAARILQVLWMRDHGIESAENGSEHAAHLSSHLSADAADAGLNFLRPDLHLLALKELVLLSETDAAVDVERLAGNSLSSMPAAVNCFGPLALDLKLAAKTMAQLLPEFVKSVVKVEWETSAGRRNDLFLSDRSAHDLAVHVITPDGERGTVFVEMKYSEDMTGPPARWRDRYETALREVRLYKNPASPLLRSVPIEQLTREHMLAQLTVDNGVTPRAIFMAIGPRLNQRVNAAFRVYSSELLPIDGTDPSRVPFRHFTLESFIDAIDVAGDQNTADQLWRRYCDFQRVYDAALSVLAPKLGAEAVTNSLRQAPANIKTSAYRTRVKQSDADSTSTTEAGAHA